MFPGSNKIVTPAGGQIFLSATSEKENKNLTVDIEGGIPSLRFKLGETDPAAFKNSADTNKVPYFEIEGEFVRLFVPSNHLAKFAAKPVDVTSSWNNKRQASNIFLGLTDKTDTPTVHSPSPVKTAIVVEGLAEFETAAAPQRLGAQTLGTLQIFARTLGVSASISPWLARYASSQGAANGF